MVNSGPNLLLVLSTPAALLLPRTPRTSRASLAVTTDGDAPVVLFASQAAARLLKWAPSELLGR